jgi:hypothetical protein
MTFRFSSTLARLLAILMIAQQTLPVSAQTEDSIHQEDRAARKAEFTAAELQGIVPTPKPEDAASPKALVLALHASISGPMGPFDWNRFRSLFLPTACIGEAGKKPGGKQHITFQSVNDWILSVQDLRPRVSVHETVYKLRIEQFESIASAFYSGHSETTEDGGTDIRGVKSCQMLYDGKRWWIASVVWNVSPKNWDLPHDLEP